MNRIRLTDMMRPQYADFADLYARSFPVFEQRTEQQQKAAFASWRYHLDLYYKEEVFVGFIAYWEFDRYSYVEHFAVHETHRSLGYGTQLLRLFMSKQANQVVLEIDPVVDEKSDARWRFYQRCAMSKNAYPHIHPPYREAYPGHSLIVLSSGGPLDQEVYDLFCVDLINEVMCFERVP